MVQERPGTPDEGQASSLSLFLPTCDSVLTPRGTPRPPRDRQSPHDEILPGRAVTDLLKSASPFRKPVYQIPKGALPRPCPSPPLHLGPGFAQKQEPDQSRRPANSPFITVAPKPGPAPLQNSAFSIVPLEPCRASQNSAFITVSPGSERLLSKLCFYHCFARLEEASCKTLLLSLFSWVCASTLQDNGTTADPRT
jgi:hypothetical protein